MLSAAAITRPLSSLVSSDLKCCEVGGHLGGNCCWRGQFTKVMTKKFAKTTQHETVLTPCPLQVFPSVRIIKKMLNMISHLGSLEMSELYDKIFRDCQVSLHRIVNVECELSPTWIETIKFKLWLDPLHPAAELKNFPSRLRVATPMFSWKCIFIFHIPCAPSITWDICISPFM